MRDIKIAHRYTERSKTVQAFLNEASKYQPLTPEQERTATKEQLVKHNMLFVVSVAKLHKIDNVDIMDLISEGLTGLMRAAEDFDPSKGFKFISYAVTWIRQRIMDYLSLYSDTVYIPRKHRDAFNKINRAKAKNEFITDDELAELIGDQGSFYVKSYYNGHSFESIDAQYDRDDDDYKKQYASDERTDALLDDYEGRSILSQCLNCLKGRDKDIFYDMQVRNMTLTEMSDKYGLTRERVRQINVLNLQKIKQQIGASLL